MADPSPLLAVLAGKPANELDAEQASLLLAEARACGVLGRLAHTLHVTTQSDSLPAPVEDALVAARIHAEGFRADVWRELARIQQALSSLNTPVVLLKGASYVLRGLPAADGRMFSDVDILVEKSQLPATEAALMLGGWATGKLDPYDQRYYREWSHEIPPMMHRRRGTTIDLHHSLVMPTCRIRVDSARMIADAVASDENGFWWHLRNEDAVLHAASHLILNSEFDRGLRDLWDIDLLYRHFSASSGDSADTTNFADRLLARARQVGLESILRQSLGLASAIFGTPCPDRLLPTHASLFSGLLARAATTRHPLTRPRGQAAADGALMLREMYYRLPGKLLLVHLLHKTTDLFSSPEKLMV